MYYTKLRKKPDALFDTIFFFTNSRKLLLVFYIQLIILYIDILENVSVLDVFGQYHGKRYRYNIIHFLFQPESIRISPCRRATNKKTQCMFFWKNMKKKNILLDT